MLVEQDPHQTRVAILEDDRLAELFIERQGARGVVGNVYKGRVSRVLPGMQAAFVDIGLERDAFLYVADVREEITDLDDVELLGDERGGANGANGGNGEGNGGGPRAAGNGGGDRPGYGERGHGADQPSIDELLRAGQEIVVQALKDPLPNKGARVSTHVTLPGRYLVYAPTGRHRGVSRRIEDVDERQRLRDLAGELAFPGGWIVRTAAEGRGLEELARDAAYLSGVWERIRQRAESAAAGSLLHQDLDLALRAVRDLFGPEVGVVWVEGEDAHQRVLSFLEEIQPQQAGSPGLHERVRLYRGERPLFERFGIEEAIEEALQPKVWLKSGG